MPRSRSAERRDLFRDDHAPGGERRTERSTRGSDMQKHGNDRRHRNNDRHSRGRGRSRSRSRSPNRSGRSRGRDRSRDDRDGQRGRDRRRRRGDNHQRGRGGRRQSGAVDKLGDKRDFLFGRLPLHLRREILTDKVAQYSVTEDFTASQISTIVADLAGHSAVVTDACACVGGNTLSFAAHFPAVTAFEFDQVRFDMLKNNVKVVGATNVTVRHGSYLDLWESVKQDVIFFDPPWGGPSYSEHDTVSLNLGGVDMGDLCSLVASQAKYIVLKLPQNFDVSAFKEKLTGCSIITENRRLRKMLLLVLECKPTGSTADEEAVDPANGAGDETVIDTTAHATIANEAAGTTGTPDSGKASGGAPAPSDDAAAGVAATENKPC